MTPGTKRLAALLAAGALALSLAAPAVAQTLRLNHNLPEDTVTGQAFNFFAARVGELSGGSLRVRVFHAGQLGGQRESMELVQQGALDMAKTNTAELEAFDPNFAVFNLPYIFTSQDHAAAVLRGPMAQGLLDATAPRGFVGLGYLFEGARSFYTVRPAASLADLAGLRIRVQPSPSAIRMVELLGAQPTPIAFGERYSALQQGVVDGAENNVSALTHTRHGEVARHFMRNEHTMIPAVYVISTQVWDRLSEAQRAILRQAAAETFEHGLAAWTADMAVQEAAATAIGVTISDVDRQPFIDALAPMITEAVAANPALGPLVEAIRATPVP